MSFGTCTRIPASQQTLLYRRVCTSRVDFDVMSLAHERLSRVIQFILEANMKETEIKQSPSVTSESAATAASKKDWQDPKLVFVEPKLTKHGAVKDLTGGFFGSFSA